MPRLLAVTALAVASVIGGVDPTSVSAQGRSGSGAELLEDCRRYFTFLGRTGVGKEETFAEDPFGIGYCAGLVRGVARSVDDFHPTIECRLDSFRFVQAIRAVVLYLEETPDALADDDTEVVVHALEDGGLCARTLP